MAATPSADMRRGGGTGSRSLPSQGSSTALVQAEPTNGVDDRSRNAGATQRSAAGRLVLRGVADARHVAPPPRIQRRVVWSSETIDNEGMGKKKSKICCIYHKPRAFDESSSSESEYSSDQSSSSSDGSDSDESFSDGARLSNVSRNARARGKARQIEHSEDEAAGECACDHPHHAQMKADSGAKAKRRGKPAKSSRSGGSRTVVITEQNHAEDTHERKRRHQQPNKYEHGVS